LTSRRWNLPARLKNRLKGTFLHKNDFVDNSFPKLLPVQFEHLGFVVAHIMFEGGRLKFNKEHLITDVDFFGSFRYSGPYDPIPCRHHTRFIKLGLEMLGLQHVLDGLGDVNGFVGDFGHGVKVGNGGLLVKVSYRK